MLIDCCLEKSNVLIYGTGGNGMEVYRQLSPFHNIIGFIDKRAKIIGNVFECPVFTVQEISQQLTAKEKENIVIIIAIKNIFSHSEIAKELLKNGFSFFIYKPYNVLKNRGDEVELRINVLYEYIVEKKQSMIKVLVPRTTQIHFKFDNKLFIRQSGNEVITWLPVELLFNYKNSYDYPGINMPLFFPLIELYKAFLGEPEISLQQAIEHFFLYCGEWLYQNGKTLTEEQKGSFLESRISIFEEMQKLAEVDMDFFKENAPLVEKNEKKFFLKSSGRNRIAFLIAKGFKYVPVKMEHEDYENWCNIDMVCEKEKEINENNITRFFAPYPNPYLVDYPVCFTDYQRLFIQPIANEVTKKIYLKNIVCETQRSRVDFDQVEREKKKTTFLLQLNDDGLAKEYFENIGFLTREQVLPSNVLKDEQVYLVTDGEHCVDLNILLGEIKFEGIYYLQRGANGGLIKLLEEHGYQLNRIIFEGVSVDGIMKGIVFRKRNT